MLCDFTSLLSAAFFKTHGDPVFHPQSIFTSHATLALDKERAATFEHLTRALAHGAPRELLLLLLWLLRGEWERALYFKLIRLGHLTQPAHGGIALGFDRLCAGLCRATSLRDVIAFPKSATGRELLVDSPAGVGEDVLKMYGIKVV